MKKLVCVICMLICLAVASQAQEGGSYKNAIGARLSGGYYDVFAASFKTFLSDQGALELNLGFRPYSGYHYNNSSYNWFNLSFSAAYQHHFPIADIEGFRWFVGGGISAYNSFSDYDAYRGFGLGLFPTGGVDYKFTKIPLNVSADIRPTFMIVEPYDYYNRFYAGNVGIAARYTF